MLLRACERDLLDTFVKEERKAHTAAGALRAAEEEAALQQRRWEAEKERLSKELAELTERAKAAQQVARTAAANPSAVVLDSGKYKLQPAAGLVAPLRAAASAATAQQPVLLPRPAAPSVAAVPALLPSDAVAPTAAPVARPVVAPPRVQLPNEVMPVFARIVSEAGSIGQAALRDKIAATLVGASARQVWQHLC
jgi:hypothetical protein